MLPRACRTRAPVGRDPPRDKAIRPVVRSVRVVPILPVGPGHRAGGRADRRVTPLVVSQAMRPPPGRVPRGRVMHLVDNRIRVRDRSSHGVGRVLRPAARGRALPARYSRAMRLVHNHIRVPHVPVGRSVGRVRSRVDRTRDADPAARLVHNSLRGGQVIRLVHNRIQVQVRHGPQVRSADPVHHRQDAGQTVAQVHLLVDLQRDVGRAVGPVHNRQVGSKLDADPAVGPAHSKAAPDRAGLVHSKAAPKPVAGRIMGLVRSKMVVPESGVGLSVRPVLGNRVGRALQGVNRGRVVLREGVGPAVDRQSVGKGMRLRVPVAGRVSKGWNRIRLVAGRRLPGCRRDSLAGDRQAERTLRNQRLVTSGVPTSQDRTHRRPRCRFPDEIRRRDAGLRRTTTP